MLGFIIGARAAFFWGLGTLAFGGGIWLLMSAINYAFNIYYSWIDPVLHSRKE